MKKFSRKSGFTLIELLIVMAVVAILVAIIIPSFKGMQDEGKIAKAEQEVQTLQTALESYGRHHPDDPFPASLSDLVGVNVKPQILYNLPKDPWSTTTNAGVAMYGYVTTNDADFGPYYIIYSWGINRSTSLHWSETANAVVGKDNDDVAVSNGPVQ
jgi:prepilin-type N-terminal cleavage/methylation domain-containing protein